MVNAESLALNQTQVRQLENLPESGEIIRLELADNGLSCEELKGLGGKYPQLSVLKLARNNLKEMKDLEFLKDLKSLKSLDLDGC